MGQKNHFHYRRDYVTSGSGIAGCNSTQNGGKFTFNQEYRFYFKYNNPNSG